MAKRTEAKRIELVLLDAGRWQITTNGLNGVEVLGLLEMAVLQQRVANMKAMENSIISDTEPSWEASA